MKSGQAIATDEKVSRLERFCGNSGGVFSLDASVA